MTSFYDLALVAHITIHKLLSYNDIYIRHPLIEYWKEVRL